MWNYSLPTYALSLSMVLIFLFDLSSTGFAIGAEKVSFLCVLLPLFALKTANATSVRSASDEAYSPRAHFSKIASHCSLLTFSSSKSSCASATRFSHWTSRDYIAGFSGTSHYCANINRATPAVPAVLIHFKILTTQHS